MLTVECARAESWIGQADLVFTNPYGQLPSCVHGLPSIITLYEESENRKALAEQWCGAALTLIGHWQQAGRNNVYVANLPVRTIDLSAVLVEQEAIEGGMFPVKLPLMLMTLYRDYFRSGLTVWDGFCGRGTVGKACKELNLSFIGLDRNPKIVEIAKRYLEL